MKEKATYQKLWGKVLLRRKIIATPLSCLIHNTSDTKSMGVFHTISPTPTGCLRIQFNSDTRYVELAPDPTGYRLGLTRLPLPQASIEVPCLPYF